MTKVEVFKENILPPDLWEVLSDPQKMNPELPDLISLTKPSELPDFLWNIPHLRPEAIEDFPHPPSLDRIFCSGNNEIGNQKNHLAQVVVQTWTWHPKEETGYGYGLWRSNPHIPISAWLPPSQIPNSYRFGNNIVDVRLTNSHGCCSQCEQEFRKPD